MAWKAVLLLCAAGCSGPKGTTLEEMKDAENLSRIEQAFEQFFEKTGKAPTGVDQLIPYLKPFGKPEEILKSPRDGQAYTIFYGINYRTKAFEDPSTIIAHEKIGKNGARYALTIVGILAIPDEEFAKAHFINEKK